MAVISEEEREEAARSESMNVDTNNVPQQPKTAKELREERERKQQELLELERKQQERKKYEAELKERRNRRKLIVPAFVLFACAVASISMALSGYENDQMLKWLLGVLIISWIVGALIHYMFEKFAKQNEEATLVEGEVINKGSVNQDEVNGEVHG